MFHESQAVFTFTDITDFFEAEGVKYFLNSERNTLQAGFASPFGKFHLQAEIG